MKILPVLQNRKDYLSLLLLADEEEHMIDRYLTRGDMYVLFDPDPVAQCVVTGEIRIHGGKKCFGGNIALEDDLLHRRQHVCRRRKAGAVQTPVVVLAAEGDVLFKHCDRFGVLDGV